MRPAGFSPIPRHGKHSLAPIRTPDGIEFEFSVKDGKLVGGNIFNDPAPLKPVDKVPFRLPGFEEATIVFEVEGGKVTGFT
jgi:hypothetical protein